jgi:hypothetical protein
MFRVMVTVASLVALSLPSPGIAHHSISHNYKLTRTVVYATFPNATQSRALGVSGCETGGHYNASAKNSKSGTLGIFQIHPGNDGRVIYWKGHGSVTIDKRKLGGRWYNAKIALYMSKGGYDWHEWAPVCRR